MFYSGQLGDNNKNFVKLFTIKINAKAHCFQIIQTSFSGINST